MANFNISPAMSLPIPVVGVAPGPDWATYVNNCLTILDTHNHSFGSGNQITPDGINLNSDLTFNSNNATLLRSARFAVQSAPIGLAPDIGCLYVSGVDLYYNDISGNKIRITQTAGVAGAPGSISNLTSPATASYAAGLSTFVFQSGATIPANIDGGSVIVRNVTAGSAGITLSAPNALAASYVLTLPPSPGVSKKLVSMSSTGYMLADIDVDNLSVELFSNNIRVKDLGISTAKLADLAVTTSKLADLAVTTSKLVDLSVTTPKLADRSVTQAKQGSVSYSTATINASFGAGGQLLTSGTVAAMGGRWLHISIEPPSGGPNYFTVDVNVTCILRIYTSAGSRYINIPSGSHPINWSVGFPLPGTGPFTETFSVEGSGFGGAAAYNLNAIVYATVL